MRWFSGIRWRRLEPVARASAQAEQKVFEEEHRKRRSEEWPDDPDAGHSVAYTEDQRHLAVEQRVERKRHEWLSK